MTQFKDIKIIDNGAKFHNVDLHIHSFGASHDVKDATMTPEAIVDSAIRQGLSVISITDHNSNANVQRALDHAEKNYAGQILVLPGVEITTAHGHLLAYFSPDRTVDLAKLLSRLDLIGDMGADNTRTAKLMADTIAEVDRLGGLCIAAHIDREKTGFEAFASMLFSGIQKATAARSEPHVRKYSKIAPKSLHSQPDLISRMCKAQMLMP